MLIREAKLFDSTALINLAFPAPINGAISLFTDRNPDFFNLLKEGGDFKIFIAGGNNGNIIGTLASRIINRKKILFAKVLVPVMIF